MNKNPILPARMDFFFPALLCPKIFPPPTYHLPTPPPITPSLELQRRRAGASLELEPGLLEQELGAAEPWSLELLEQGSCGKHLYFFFRLFVCFVCFICSSLLCSCGAALQCSVCRCLLLPLLEQRYSTTQQRRRHSVCRRLLLPLILLCCSAVQ
jgi:hypothetical protein